MADSEKAAPAPVSQPEEPTGTVLNKIDLDNVPEATIEDVLNPDEYSDEYYRKLRLKIDFWLLPIMWFCRSSWPIYQL